MVRFDQTAAGLLLVSIRLIETMSRIFLYLNSNISITLLCVKEKGKKRTGKNHLTKNKSNPTVTKHV